jgi:hypothetical protein
VVSCESRVGLLLGACQTRAGTHQRRPSQLDRAPIDPSIGEVEGPGEGCWVVADPGDPSAQL